MKTVEVNLYQFDELDDKAKEVYWFLADGQHSTLGD